MDNLLTQFKNCRILRNSQFIKEDLWVRNGKIVNPEKIFYDEMTVADTTVDCANCIIAPGYIDIQINGAFGTDFSNLKQESAQEEVNKVSKGLLAHGVTAYCPTMVTSPRNVYHEIKHLIRNKPHDKAVATILGLHLEGPFINAQKKGAHPSHCILSLDKGFKTIQDIYGNLDNVSMITVAPELPGAQAVIKKLTSSGIVVSLGHSMANLIDGEEAVKNGASIITHLFNAMPPFHHRDPGLVGLLTSDQVDGKTIFYGVICDGIHTHPAALRIAYKANPHGLVLVTDAISAMGFPQGTHKIGQYDIEICDGRALIANTSTLCGSIASMDQSVQLFHEFTGCSKEYALEAASLHPAQAIKAMNKGQLDFGFDADFVFLNDNLELQSTWIAGKRVYSK